MALWSKKKEAEPKQALLSFNREGLLEKLNSGWNQIYDLRPETSWRLLMSQLQTMRNIYIIDISNLKSDEATPVAYARIKGRIEALSSVENLLETEFKRLKMIEDTSGKKDTHAQSIIKSRKPKKKPTISL